MSATARSLIALLVVHGIGMSGAPAAAAAGDASGAGARRSVSGWVSCSGHSDDTAGFTKALAAAAHGAFTLVVDCPVRLKIGTDIDRSIFVDDGTTVEFAGAGKLSVDNEFIPAFVIADTSQVVLTDWNVEYDGGIPVDPNVGYYRDGRYTKNGKAPNAFNDLRLTSWLSTNRGVTFDRRFGNINALWTGATNPCAVFFITGDSSHITVNGMKLYVPAAAGGERFIPVAFTLGQNFRRNQTVTSQTPRTAQYFGLPHDIRFSNIQLDGTYMGWVGGMQDAVFENIESLRYGDLQDANGENVGGVKKWFAPPHLFYFAYSTDGDPGLFNTHITIKNVVDKGLRVGRARDAGGTDSISGYTNSIKLGCVNCSVDHYSTARPDGFLDLLGSDGLTISNVSASYNSAFLNDLFPAWRFPSSGYKNVTFENITVTDTSPTTGQFPIGNAGQPSNENLVLRNVQVEMNQWTGPGALPLPVINGRSNDVSLDYRVRTPAWHIVKSIKGSVDITLQQGSATGPAGTIAWAARGADHCSGGGAWSGPLPASGSKPVEVTSGADEQISITCTHDADLSTATATLRLSP